MKLILESQNVEDYLKEIPGVIEFSTPLVKEKIKEIQLQTNDKRRMAEIAFELSRDQIHHSFDTKNPMVVTISAEDALREKEGICFAKAHLFAALCRGMGIPTGFCYQRVVKNGQNTDAGHALHGLNALYLDGVGWFRVDPRGNKPGVDSQFSIEEEKLAYPIRESLGEMDYPNVFTQPLISVLDAMKSSETSRDLVDNRPDKI